MNMYEREWSTGRGSGNGYEDEAATVLVTAHRLACFFLTGILLRSLYKPPTKVMRTKTTLLTTIQMKKKAL